MPLREEMFDYLGNMDRSTFRNLPVYGDLLDFYCQYPELSLYEAGQLYQELQLLEKKILSLYVTFVLAEAGFYIRGMREHLVAQGERDFPDYEENDWAEAIEWIEPVDEMALEADWSIDYENEAGEARRVTFVTLFHWENGEQDEAHHLMNRFEESASNYVIVHPRLCRCAKMTFRTIRDQVQQLIGESRLFSPSEFTARVIPEEAQRDIVERIWEAVRQAAIRNLTKDHPILVRAQWPEMVEDVEDNLRVSQGNYMNRNLAAAIQHAGMACEGILSLYYLSIKGARPDRMTLSDYLGSFEKEIIQDFGQNIFNDLEFIRLWRNNVVHPGHPRPTEPETVEVVKKTELFYRLFKIRYFRRRRA